MRFSNYYNREGRNRNIYSRKNILGMTMKEMLERELELAYQYNTIGIPADQELLNSEFAHQYMDEQGNSRWQAGKQEFPAQPTLTQNTVANVQYPQPQTSGMLEGFGQSETKDLGSVEKKNEFPDLGKAQNLVSQNNPMTSPAVADVKPFVKEQKSLGSYGNLVQSDLSDDINLDENFNEITEEPYLNYEDLLPDETEEERRARETAELEVFNKAWDKANGVEDESDENDILSYEDMLRLDSDEDSVEDDSKLETLLKKIPTDKLEDFLQKFKKEELASDVKQNSPREKILKKEILQNAKPEILEENIGKEEIGFLTGAAAGVDLSMMRESPNNIKEIIKNIPNKIEKINVKNYPAYLKNKFLEYANKDFDKNKPMTIEEKVVQQGIEKIMGKHLPMASNATRNGMHDMEAAKNQNNVKVYDNLESLEDTKLKETLKKIGAKNSDKGAIYNIGSRESEIFSNSPELDVYLTKNRANVLAGKPLEDTSLYYDANSKDVYPWNNPKKFDRYATARKISVVNPKVDENGIFTCDLVDYSNFDDESVNSIGTYLNKWGYKMQEKGHYKPHYQIIKIRKKVNW